MNDQEFNRQLNSMSHDLKLLWNPQKKLWGVYQVRAHSLVNAWGAPIEAKPWLLFDIVDERGHFRLPDQRDLRRAANSIYSAHRLWDKGGDWYTDRIEAQEAERSAKAKAKVADDLKAAAKEVKFHTSVILPKGARR